MPRRSLRLLLTFGLLTCSTVLAMVPFSQGYPGWKSVIVVSGSLQALCGGFLFGILGPDLWRSLFESPTPRASSGNVVVPARHLQTLLHHEWFLSEGSLICPECKRADGEGHGTDCQRGRSFRMLGRILDRNKARNDKH